MHTFGRQYRVVLQKSKTLYGGFQCAFCKISETATSAPFAMF